MQENTAKIIRRKTSKVTVCKENSDKHHWHRKKIPLSSTFRQKFRELAPMVPERALLPSAFLTLIAGGSSCASYTWGHRLLHSCRHFQPGCACCSARPNTLANSTTREKGTDVSASSRNPHGQLRGEGQFNSCLKEANDSRFNVHSN